MRRWLLVVLAAAAFAGCDPNAEEDPDRGIAVGNPGLLSVSMAVTADVEVTAATLAVSSFEFAGCGGYAYASTSGGTVDLAAEPEGYDFTEGSWCGVRINAVGVFHVEATSGASAISLDLEVDDISVGADVAFDAEESSEFAFELGTVDWLAPVVAALVGDEDLSIDVEHELHDELVAALQLDSALFDDLDGSGVVEDPERDAGALATGEIQLSFDIAPNAAGYTSDSATSGCGMSCDSGGGGAPGAVGFLLVLALVGSRRRSHRG
ncbi:MAG: hypothetical protein GY898_30350 [Proteobacteria bacterium]|nr:hypothetical protein [Pseudomonadota bacterium]